MKTYKIQDLGYQSWMELYHELEAKELLDGKIIQIHETDPAIVGAVNDKDLGASLQAPGIDICVDYVRARAFEELYHKLPLSESVEVLIDLLNDPKFDDDVLTVIIFLKKLQTRAK